MSEISQAGIGAGQIAGTLLRDPPTVELTAPVGAQDTSTVTLAWTYASALGKVQRTFRVQILGQSSESILYDSGTIDGDDGTFECPFVLSGGSLYTAKVIVSDGVDTGFAVSSFSSDLVTVADSPVNDQVGSLYEIAINGVGYRLADTSERPYRRSTAQLQAPRLATGETPFSEAVERYTFVGAGDWSFGAGQRFGNRETSDARAFWDSENVNPFDPGRITLLRATDELLATPTGAVGVVVASGHLFAATAGDTLQRLTAVGVTPDVMTFTGDTLKDLASDGTFWYALNTDDEIFRGSGTTIGAVWSDLSTPAAGASIIEWCSDRLAVVYENASGQSVLSTVAPDGTEEVANGRFKYSNAEIVAVTAGDGYLWFAVNRSGRSVIYAWRLGSEEGATIALDLPTGERVTALYHYLGNVMIRTATDERAVIYRSVAGQGELTPERVLTIEDTDGAEGPFVGFDRFVMFGWKGMSTDGRSGVGAIDLSTGGWCRWSRAAAVGDTGAVTELFVWGSQVGFLVDGSGPQFPSTDTWEASGFVQSSVQDLASSLVKVYDTVSVGLDPLPAGATVDMAMSFDNATSFTSFGSIETAGAREARWAVGRQGSSVATKITLTATGAAAPAISMVQTKLHPLSVVDSVVELPIACTDRQSGLNGQEIPSSDPGLARARVLESLVGSRVSLQDVDWPTTGLVSIWEVVSTEFTSVGVFERGQGHRREAAAVCVATLRSAR